MKLVIVESPTKAKTISKFLGSDYKVESSYGHVRDLPKSVLGIDIENNFTPKYIVPQKAKKLVTALKKEVKASDVVILATDEDREGEAIAWHLAEALGLANPKFQAKKVIKTERIVFHEITKSAIENALNNPRTINEHLVDAQQARRVLDRIVGYRLSPFLWKKVAGGLSAGRVQSVALKLIVDREKEIRAFKPEEYWTIAASLVKAESAEQFLASLAKKNGKTLDKFAINNKDIAEKIAAELKASKFAVSKIETKEIKKTPLPPFTTSTLQQDAARKLGFSTKKTMLLAQRLYENGHITYMRTDSVNLSTEATAQAKKWLEEKFGAQYAAEAPRKFTSKSKLAQEAHEAIRPTKPEEVPETAPVTDPGEKKLYTLIWQRFMASQMPHARISTLSVEILANSKLQTPNSNVYILKATGQQILFDGFLKVWPQKLEERTLPSLKENEALTAKEILPEQHFTEPPARYSEASLVKTLEEYGIGRPSTYAPIISVIQARNYVAKDRGRFSPTEIGELVTKVLAENFSEIVDVRFTAHMEDELDDVAQGKTAWQSVIREFYDPFASNLAKKYEEVAKQQPEATNEVCDRCGKPMVIRMGRFGKFMACSGFPECKNTKKVAGGAQKEAPKSIGLKCPKCSDGDIVERRVSRGRARGKIFWGCSKYPACDYASWTNPTQEKTSTTPSTEAEKSAEENEEPAP